MKIMKHVGPFDTHTHTHNLSNREDTFECLFLSRIGGERRLD